MMTAWLRARVDPDPVVAFLDGMIVALILVLVAAYIVRMIPWWLG